jgi:hypothetical protein
MDQLHVWTVTIDDAEKTFPTLEAATGYLGKSYQPTVKAASIESRLVDAEEFVRLTEGKR